MIWIHNLWGGTSWLVHDVTHHRALIEAEESLWLRHTCRCGAVSIRQLTVIYACVIHVTHTLLVFGSSYVSLYTSFSNLNEGSHSLFGWRMRWRSKSLTDDEFWSIFPPSLASTDCETQFRLHTLFHELVCTIYPILLVDVTLGKIQNQTHRRSCRFCIRRFGTRSSDGWRLSWTDGWFDSVDENLVGIILGS